MQLSKYLKLRPYDPEPLLLFSLDIASVEAKATLLEGGAAQEKAFQG